MVHHPPGLTFGPSLVSTYHTQALGHKQKPQVSSSSPTTTSRCGRQTNLLLLVAHTQVKRTEGSSILRTSTANRFLALELSSLEICGISVLSCCDGQDSMQHPTPASLEKLKLTSITTSLLPFQSSSSAQMGSGNQTNFAQTPTPTGSRNTATILGRTLPLLEQPNAVVLLLQAQNPRTRERKAQTQLEL